MYIPQPRKIAKIQSTISELQPLYQKFTLKSNQLHTTQCTNQQEKLQDELKKITQAQIVDSVLLEKYKLKCSELIETCEKLVGVVNQQKSDYQELERRYKEVVSKEQDSIWGDNVGEERKEEIKEGLKIEMKGVEIQTEYWVPIIEIKQVANLQGVEKKKTEGEQKADIVLNQLNQYLSSISVQVNNSLQNIKDQQLTLKDIIEKNEELSKQNNRLKDQIKQFNMNTEKFKVWKQEVQSKMSKLQSLAQTNQPSYVQVQGVYEPYQPTSDIQIKQQNIYLNSQLKKLQNIAQQLELKLNAQKLKNKMIARIPTEQQPISQEHNVNIQETVKTLTELSSKLKVVSTYLLS